MQTVISKVDMHCFPAMARWIHPQMEAAGFLAMLETNVQRLLLRQSPRPLQALVDDERVAAAYFTLLPGRVATLGGVRAVQGHEHTASELIQHLTSELKAELGLTQVQAILANEDFASKSILAAGGFEPLTTVQHLWRFGSMRRQYEAPPQSPLDVRWKPASELAPARLAEIIAATFVETLDCPALNGRRSESDVLDGFLEGGSLSHMKDWEVLEVDGKCVGCLLLKHYGDNRITELVYMGVVPEMRGQALGGRLLDRTLEHAHRARAEVVVVAVDDQNAPALRLYQQYGFSHHTSWSVWLCKS